MNKIDPSLFLSNQNLVREPKPTLDKDGFLKILMTQLQNQDPTAPMDQSQMIQQMTTLTSLEQMMNMSKSIELLVNNQLISPVIQYSHLIGNQVTYETMDDAGKTIDITAKVISVSQNEGIALLDLDNGKTIKVDEVTKISEAEGNDNKNNENIE